MGSEGSQWVPQSMRVPRGSGSGRSRYMMKKRTFMCIIWIQKDWDRRPDPRLTTVTSSLCLFSCRLRLFITLVGKYTVLVLFTYQYIMVRNDKCQDVSVCRVFVDEQLFLYYSLCGLTCWWCCCCCFCCRVIDNQALEDLSLVLNITQTIKVKSSSSDKKDGTGENKQETPNSLADHFPSFLWVLRDFSLKLVDDKGKRITSHTYFENCLLPQAGFSEGVEAKNRIRNLITECFRDRDCVALVRPAEDEEVGKLEERS